MTANGKNMIEKNILFANHNTKIDGLNAYQDKGAFLLWNQINHGEIVWPNEDLRLRKKTQDLEKYQPNAHEPSKQ